MESRDKWYFDHLKEVHKKKINLINSNSTKRIDNSPPNTLQISKGRVASYQNLRNQEYHEIYRKNQVILDALNEISNRKVKFTQAKTQKIYKPAVKSLNIKFRNKMTRKIIEENELMLNKLSSKGATISVKKLNEDFKLSLAYKKNLTRRLFNEGPIGINKKKLPKIERSPNMRNIIKKTQSESDFRGRKSELPRDLKKEVEDDLLNSLHSEKEKASSSLKDVKESKERDISDNQEEENKGSERNIGVKNIRKDQEGILDTQTKRKSDDQKNSEFIELKQSETFKEGKAQSSESNSENFKNQSKNSSKSSSSNRKNRSNSSESKKSNSDNKEV